MSGRVTFEKEIKCGISDFFGCETAWSVARRKMDTQFDALVCDPKHPAGSESPDSYTVVCSGRPNARRREMLKLDAAFREFTNKLLMTAINTVVDGTLKLIGADPSIANQLPKISYHAKVKALAKPSKEERWKNLMAMAKDSGPVYYGIGAVAAGEVFLAMAVGAAELLLAYYGGQSIKHTPIDPYKIGNIDGPWKSIYTGVLEKEVKCFGDFCQNSMFWIQRDMSEYYGDLTKCRARDPFDHKNPLQSKFTVVCKVF